MQPPSRRFSRLTPASSDSPLLSGTTHVHTKPCSRRWSTACAFAERYPYFTTDRPMDGGSVLLTQPIAQGPIPFLPSPKGRGYPGRF